MGLNWSEEQLAEYEAKQKNQPIKQVIVDDKCHTEKLFQAKVVKLAEDLGWKIYHTYDSRRSNPGFPDLVMVHFIKKRTIFAELKTLKGKITPEQYDWLNKLKLAGNEVYTWRPTDLSEIEMILK